ncbi:MAG: hypothetical protein ACK56I_24715, partial [bacterium]
RRWTGVREPALKNAGQAVDGVPRIYLAEREKSAGNATVVISSEIHGPVAHERAQQLATHCVVEGFHGERGVVSVGIVHANGPFLIGNALYGGKGAGGLTIG